jgi:hypothetical protein
VCDRDFQGHLWLDRRYAAENFLAADAERQDARQNQDGPNQVAVLTFPDAVHQFLASVAADVALFQRTDYFPGAELLDAAWVAGAAEHCRLSVKRGQLILPKKLVQQLRALHRRQLSAR